MQQSILFTVMLGSMNHSSTISQVQLYLDKVWTTTQTIPGTWMWAKTVKPSKFFHHMKPSWLSAKVVSMITQRSPALLGAKKLGRDSQDMAEPQVMTSLVPPRLWTPERELMLNSCNTFLYTSYIVLLQGQAAHEGWLSSNCWPFKHLIFLWAAQE